MIIHIANPERVFLKSPLDISSVGRRRGINHRLYMVKRLQLRKQFLQMRPDFFCLFGMRNIGAVIFHIDGGDQVSRKVAHRPDVILRLRFCIRIKAEKMVGAGHHSVFFRVFKVLCKISVRQSASLCRLDISKRNPLCLQVLPVNLPLIMGDIHSLPPVAQGHPLRQREVSFF